jgi:hypothetical protein
MTSPLLLNNAPLRLRFLLFLAQPNLDMPCRCLTRPCGAARPRPSQSIDGHLALLLVAR